MENYDVIIEEVHSILDKAEQLTENDDIEMFLEENAEILVEFRDSFSLMLRLYNFTEYGEKIKEVVLRILRLDNVLEKHYRFQYYKSSLLNDLDRVENYYAFDLQAKDSMDETEKALKYLKIREEYISVLLERNCFQDQDLNVSAAKRYVNSDYESNMFGHALMQIKKNMFNLPKEKIEELIHAIDDTNFFSEIISKSWKKMSFFEQNLVEQYIQTVLKMKMIFMPDKMKDDKVIRAVLDGKVNDSKVLSKLFDSFLVYAFEDAYISENPELKNGFYLEFANHLAEVGMDTQNIAMIINSMAKKQENYRAIAKVWALAGIPKDYDEFIESEHSENLKWLEDWQIFTTFQNLEKKIESGYISCLPVEYYIKKIENTPELSSDSQLIRNLYTLINSNYYFLEEAEILKKCLKDNGLWYEEILSNDEMQGNNEPLDGSNKQIIDECSVVIPLEEATEKINDFLSGKIKIDNYSCQMYIRSIITNTLRQFGIENDIIVLFGKKSGTGGYFERSNNVIWINTDEIDSFIKGDTLEKKSKLFEIIFHEMQHALQNHNIRNGNIDFLTYNFILEEVIKEYDVEFYNNNYTRMFKEVDARKGGILECLKFLKGLNPQFVQTIRKNLENRFKKEAEINSIPNISKKKLSAGKDYFIDVSEYVGLLIANNPNILHRNPLLNIQYQTDGSEKSIETLLDEFELQFQNGVNKDWIKGYGENSNLRDINNLYGIYEGIINRRLEKEEVDNELKIRVTEFFEKYKSLVSEDKYKSIYETSDKRRIEQVFSDLCKIAKNEKIIGNEPNRGDENK